MIAMERGRRVLGVLVTLAAFGGLGQEAVMAQGFGRGNQVAKTKPAPKAQAAQPANNREQVPVTLVPKALPANPTDPICTVNNEVITRQHLADECVIRKGEEILETLINRLLIEQALRAKKLEVRAEEVDAEIESVARRVAQLPREAWLRTLAKERGISPVQYARDIIYPALALRKLASDRVTVTDKDIQIAFEAQYGDKIRCRLIMTDKLHSARTIWESLRKNPAGFAKLAEQVSMDQGSAPLGGLLAEPITRHAYPQTVSDAAFAQLVDGDPRDRDPSHKPKDGDFTGPIQVAEATWVIIQRESLIAAQTGISLTDQTVRKQCHEMIYDVKLKEAMNQVMVDLIKHSRIDNKLTGRVKEPNEEELYSQHADGNVKLMAGEAATPRAQAPGTASTADHAVPSVPTPPGVPQDEVFSKQAEQIRKAPLIPQK